MTAIPDKPDQLRAAIAAEAHGADLIVTAGGISAGAYEVVKDAYTGRGVQLTTVAMSPGRPQGAGNVDGIPLIALPGNPVSTLVSYEVFVRPALRAAMGHHPSERPVLRAKLATAIRARPGWRRFSPGILDRDRGAVLPIHPSRRHFLSAFSAATYLIETPEDAVDPAAGTVTDAWNLTSDQ